MLHGTRCSANQHMAAALKKVEAAGLKGADLPAWPGEHKGGYGSPWDASPPPALGCII